METTMTIREAVTASFKLLDEVSVKGYPNSANLVRAQELLAKVIRYLEEQEKEKAKSEEPTIEIEPVDADTEQETAKE